MVIVELHSQFQLNDSESESICFVIDGGKCSKKSDVEKKTCRAGRAQALHDRVARERELHVQRAVEVRVVAHRELRARAHGLEPAQHDKNESNVMSAKNNCTNEERACVVVCVCLGI